MRRKKTRRLECSFRTVPFALLRAPVGLSISDRMCIHWMPGSAAGSPRASSARNVLNSQSAAIAFSAASLSRIGRFA